MGTTKLRSICYETIVFIFFGLVFFVVCLMLCVDIGLLLVAFCTLNSALHTTQFRVCQEALFCALSF